MGLLRLTIITLAASLALPGNPLFGLRASDHEVAPSPSFAFETPEFCADNTALCATAAAVSSGVRKQIVYTLEVAQSWIDPDEAENGARNRSSKKRKRA